MSDNSYPAWRFHPTRPAQIVDDAQADAALGPGWFDSYAKFLDSQKGVVWVEDAKPTAPVDTTPVVAEPRRLEVDDHEPDPKPRVKPRSK